MPEFDLIDMHGAPVDEAILRGGWTVVDFIFTSCTLQCPVMTGQMSRLQGMLEGTPVRLVSISIDGAHDTPDVLRSYADAYDADPERWTFLTGDAEIVHEIVRALGFALYDDPDEANAIIRADGSTMANIVHPSRFVIFDPEGRVVGMCNGMREDDVNQLAVDLKRTTAR